MGTPFTFGIVGSGWRAEFFVRLARLLPDQLTLVGASVRRSEAAGQLTRRWSVPAFLSPEELVRSRRPDFVISCVSPSANPEVVSALVESGVRVLGETPPAPGLDGLRKLWARVGGRDLVQVAEQYPAYAGSCRAARTCHSRGDRAAHVGAGLLNAQLSRGLDNQGVAGGWLRARKGLCLALQRALGRPAESSRLDRG